MTTQTTQENQIYTYVMVKIGLGEYKLKIRSCMCVTMYVCMYVHIHNVYIHIFKDETSDNFNIEKPDQHIRIHQGLFIGRPITLQYNLARYLIVFLSFGICLSFVIFIQQSISIGVRFIYLSY